jgi:hypothetical protein
MKKVIQAVLVGCMCFAFTAVAADKGSPTTKDEMKKSAKSKGGTKGKHKGEMQKQDTKKGSMQK